MDNPRAEKVAVVDEVRQHFDEADAAILTEYRGLKVKELAELRRSLAPAGGEYRIYKNTLVRFAARDAGLAGLDEMLTGPTAIAFVKGDAAAVAKSLREYSKTQPLLVIKGGVLGDKVISSDEAAALADLPSRDVLLARFAGALAAPLQQLAVRLLQALPRNLAYGLAALVEQRVAAGEEMPSEPESSAAEPEPSIAEPEPSTSGVDQSAPEPGESPAADAGTPEAIVADVTPVADQPPDGEPAVEEPAAADDPAPSDVPASATGDADEAADAVTDSPAAVAGTPEAALALDDATSPVLAAEAQDPAPE